MAQKTQYTVYGLPGQIRVFSPKTEGPSTGPHTGLFTTYTVQGIPGQRYSFLPKTETVSTFTHMRGMILGIEYETILEDVSPSDTDDLANIGMLYIGTTGDVKVTSVKGDTVTLKNVPSGTWLNFCRVKKVFNTGTTASDIVLAR
jgi:hypothetical protein